MINKLLLILGSAHLALLSAISAEGKPWRGIVPLHSSRQEVEKVLGQSKDPCKCMYKTPTEVVTIEYARQTCRQNPNGWNVPRGTVLTINVAPTSPSRFSDLKIDEGKYQRRKDLHTPAIYYSNEEEGIMYEVSDDGLVSLTVYGPSSDDFKLKCDHKKARSQLQPTFDEYGQITFDNEKARLDNYAAQLNYLSESVGYIVVYPASEKSLPKSLRRARRARSYLVRVRRVKAGRIAVIEGGCRDAFTIELYILPKISAAPRPQPSICRRYLKHG